MVFAQAFCRKKLLNTETVAHRSFYAEKLLHTEAFKTQKLSDRKAFRQRNFYTQTLLHTQKHTEAFTQKSFTQWNFYTQKLFTDRSFHTDREPCTQRSFYTQEFAAPKPDLGAKANTNEALFRLFTRNLQSQNGDESADKSPPQPWYSQSNTIYDAQQKTKVLYSRCKPWRSHSTAICRCWLMLTCKSPQNCGQDHNHEHEAQPFRTRLDASPTRRPNKLPLIAAEQHVVWENIEFGAIPTLSCITGRSNPTSLWWCGDVVMWCDVVMWWCEDVVMGWCIVVVIYCFCDVLFWWFWWYIIVVMYYCGDVLLWWCIVVVMYCSGDVLLWWCIVGGCFFLTSIFQKFRATEFRLLNFLWRRQSCKNQQPRIRKQLWDILVQMSQVPIYLVEAAFTGIPKTETDRFGDSY